MSFRLPDGRATRWLTVALAYTFGTLLGLFVPSRLSYVNIFRIGGVGLGLATLFLFSAGYVVPGGASEFTQWAEAIAHGSKLPAGVSDRDVGFPLMLLLGGYTLTDSFIGITLIHSVFAILMPLFVYGALRPFSINVAYLFGQIANFCFGSFQFIKMIHHDQVYVFFSVLMCLCIILFFTQNSYRYLYLFSLSCLAASISRPAGNLLFPPFLVLAFIAGPRPRHLRHYLICAVIFVGATGLYQWHRYVIFDVRNQPQMPSYVGQQVFYNLYMNSREYGITLGPDIGPNMRIMDTALRDALGPVPRDSSIIKNVIAATVPKLFYEAEFRDYSTEDLIHRIYLVPNWEYYQLICYTTPSDALLIKASLEIIKKYPIYFLRYSLRNALVFLFHPGFAHTRYNVNPLAPIAIYFYPTLTGVAETNGIAPRASKETQVAILDAEPRFIRNVLKLVTESIGTAWENYYQTFVRATAILMLLSWIALVWAALCAMVDRWHRGNTACETTKLWSQSAFSASVIAVALLLLYSAAITGTFAEPDYRYHHFVLLLRVIAAGLGAIVLLRVLPGELPERWKSSIPGRDITALHDAALRCAAALLPYDPIGPYVAARPRRAAMLLMAATVIAFGGWAVVMVRLTG